jgi:solute carrier family 25 folate transporter 32
MDQSDSNKKNVKTFFGNVNPKTFIAGTVGGVSSTIIFHPLELIKIRWQVYESITLKNLIKKDTLNLDRTNLSYSPNYRPKYKSLFDTFNTVYKSENGIRGLYRGLFINSFASGSAWGIYFLIYNGLKSRHQQIINSNNKNGQTQNLSFLDYTIDATAAGVFTICITNPLFLIKTRMCLQYSNVNLNNNNIVKYKNSWEALKILVKQDGVLGLYKGIIPGLFGTLNGNFFLELYSNV